MGKQTNIKLRGTVENIIFYQWKGIHCIRTKPAAVRQAPVAKKNAAIFGKASRQSAVIRAMLKPVLPMPGSRIIMHRMNNAFRNWLYTNPLEDESTHEAIPFFENLSLNEKNQLQQFLKLKLILNRQDKNTLLLRMPAFVPDELVKAPKDTSRVRFTISIASMQAKDALTVSYHTAEITVAYTKEQEPARDLALPCIKLPAVLSLVVLSITYFKGEQPTTACMTPAWLPAGIIGSFYN